MEDYFKDLGLIVAGAMIGIGIGFIISILTEKKPNNTTPLKESEK
jgi:hypothetical protein